MNQPGTDLHPDLWVGLVTLVPWVLIYFRGFIAEIGKSSAQALWGTISRRRRKQQRESTVTVVIVVAQKRRPERRQRS